uniref:Smr domain-containing protein n=1 Tax=Onchocerca volvulus TaxID=6282 RepID=A0A8R1Y552_ONCVO
MVVPNIHEQCWEPTTSLNDIRKCIQNGHHIMVILRGIPGSGKSCLASDLVSGTNGAVFSSDKYFMQSGVYKFDPTKLDEYHHKNWIEAKKAIQHGIKPIIIDNTNIFVAHMKPYITLAVKNLYEIYFVEPETEWKKNVKECTRRSAHFVPEEKIAYMAECFEKINLTDIIKPTQLRIIPPLIDMDDSDNTYSLLLPKLDSSLSEYPENVRKANAEKEEIERAELLPSDISQCSLYDAVNLLKISSADLEKDVIDKKKTSEQLFSLIPPQISKKSLRTVGCQTSDLIRIFDLSDSLPSVSDEFLWGTIQNDIDLNNKKKMKGKMVQAGDGNILLDIELLLALFPNEKPSDLSHILEIVGLNNAVTLLKEMNGNMNVCTPVDKNKNIEAEPLSKTYYWWDETEFERISNNSSPLFVPNLGMKTAIPEKLAPCTYMQCSDPEPVPEGYYRMEISVDMMQQLTQLFGNSENSNFLKTYVDLPIWLWRQIYLCWQGESTTKVNNGFEDFDFSIFTNPDEELARILQNHELAFDESLENGKHMNIAERLQLSALINHYSEVDRERVIECFRDNKFSAEATRNTLELFVNGTENIQRALVDPSGIASSINQPGSCQFASNGLSVPKPDLKSVHEDACELRKEADRYNKQKEEMLTRAKNQRELGAKMFYFSEAQKFGKKAKDCVAELNERLTKANTWDLFIDLHYMDVQSAIKLLKSKLNAADRPVDLRRGRSGKKLVVLTGYGKLNNGQAKIRPAVTQWLEQCGYEYCNTSNKGELIVECK